jgi:hypothetical protein
VRSPRFLDQQLVGCLGNPLREGNTMNVRAHTLNRFFLALVSWLASSQIAYAIDESLLSEQDQTTSMLDPAASDLLIRNAEGRISYIFELKESTARSLSKNFLPNDRFQEYQKGQIVNLVKQIEWDHRIQIESMTSWINASFSAFVSDEQLEELKADPRIIATYANTGGNTFSGADTTAVWNNTRDLSAYVWTTAVPLPTELQSWGKQAVDNRTANSTGNALVYIVDAGVGQHEDLNVIERANPLNVAKNCGSRTGVTPALAACNSTTLPYLVGCYTHSTAVAGIIGAKVNGVGVQGIAPNTNIISVAVGSTVDTTYNCLIANLSAMNIHTALDWVYHDILDNRHSNIASVVNLSINWTMRDAAHIALETDMRTLSNSIPGAFVVQSAGNFYDSNACNHGYGVPAVADGIMTVGAINNHGQPVMPLNDAMGFYKDYTAFGIYEPGSNYGSCVEAWAPGDAIITSVGPANSYSQNSSVLYRNYGFGSGTSFAAPHVVGLAVRLIESSLYTQASAVEQAVRNNMSSLGSVDPSGRAMSLPTRSPLPAGTPHNTPYAEFIASKQCVYPSSRVALPSAGCRKLMNLDNASGNYGIYGNGDTLANYTTYQIGRNRGVMTSANPGTVWFSFDSYGAGSNLCDVKVADLQGGSRTIAAAAQQYYSIPDATLSPYFLFYSSTCPSASLQVH